jgi:hypothetical protein
VGKHERRDSLEDLEVDETKILKCILEKQDWRYVN